MRCYAINIPMPLLKNIFVLSLLCLLAACAGDKDEDKYVERPPEEIYTTAQKYFNDGDYNKSAREFDEVDRQHPYSEWALRAQLMAAYSQYQAMNYAAALKSLENFIQQNPGHKDAAYAYYLRALCYYEQIVDITRDQQTTNFALESFRDVITRFPETKYARDAQLKIDLALGQLAGREMDIGRYYQKRGIYQAAINRYDFVVKEYQTTGQAPEALLRMTESYLALGLQDEARKTAAVLGYNYPNNEWYKAAYALLVKDGAVPPDEEEPWLRRQVKKIL
jgi:outer membrane protein assembly factor BamD